MKLRHAKYHDINEIIKIIDDAKIRLKAMKIDQWQNGYPNIDSVVKDIDDAVLYVLEENSTIQAIASIIHTPEPTYAVIAGRWGNSTPYITLHRIATKHQSINKGIGASLLSEIKKQFSDTSIRVDTHHDNIPMKHLLLKNGFTYRGIIVLSDGTPRDAYDIIPCKSRVF